MGAANTAPMPPGAVGVNFAYAAPSGVFTATWSPANYDVGNSSNSIYFNVVASTFSTTLNADRKRINNTGTFLETWNFGTPNLGNYIRPSISTGWAGYLGTRMEGFILSHTVAQTDIPDQGQVDDFLPPTDIPHRLGAVPHTLGQIEIPHQTEMHRWQHNLAMLEVPQIYGEIQNEFEAVFGRRLADAVVAYRAEDADTLIVSMGTIGATAERVVDTVKRLRELSPLYEMAKEGVDLKKVAWKR